jgi:DNA-binding PadR family transcriptional regulator
MGIQSDAVELVPGTLDMLILKTLANGPMHGYGIAQRIRLVSEGVLEVGEGSLYPALQRLLVEGWTVAEWAITEKSRHCNLPAPSAP